MLTSALTGHTIAALMIVLLTPSTSDGRRSGLRTRGTREPIIIIEIDEPAINASKVRLQKWRRDWYARLIERASKGGASVIGLDIFLSEEGGVSADDKAYDQQLSKAMSE